MLDEHRLPSWAQVDTRLNPTVCSALWEVDSAGDTFHSKNIAFKLCMWSIIFCENSRMCISWYVKGCQTEQHQVTPHLSKHFQAHKQKWIGCTATCHAFRPHYIVFLWENKIELHPPVNKQEDCKQIK